MASSSRAEVLLGVGEERLEPVQHRLDRDRAGPVPLHGVGQLVQEPTLLAVIVVDERERHLGNGIEVDEGMEVC